MTDDPRRLPRGHPDAAGGIRPAASSAAAIASPDVELSTPREQVLERGSPVAQLHAVSVAVAADRAAAELDRRVVLRRTRCARPGAPGHPDADRAAGLVGGQQHRLERLARARRATAIDVRSACRRGEPARSRPSRGPETAPRAGDWSRRRAGRRRPTGAGAVRQPSSPRGGRAPRPRRRPRAPRAARARFVPGVQPVSLDLAAERVEAADRVLEPAARSRRSRDRAGSPAAPRRPARPAPVGPSRG